MYNEEKNERSYFFRNLIVKILLILLFIFLLMWLFPMPNLNPFYDKVFTENVSNMTDAAKGYFTTSRLPKKEDETKKLTLKEMLDNKMIIAFTDVNGKTCDLNKSYVEVTKKDGEYVFKTNLSCSNKEDYVIEYFGCYDVCEDGTCDIEKTPATVTEDVTEYRFYKISKDKLIDKYVCKDGYTLEGTKCILKTNVEKKENATISCLKGYTYNKNTNICEKDIVETLDASKTCKTGYIYATSMDKCIKLDKNVVEADLTYKCDKGVLNGTKCIITNTISVDAEKVYACTKGTLDGTTCIVTEDANLTYICDKGVLNGTKCIITNSKTTPRVCGYTKWVCSQTQSKNTMNVSSTAISTVRYLYQNSSSYYVYEVCNRRYDCTGGQTTTTTSSVDAEKKYSCENGTLDGTTCKITKDALLLYRCNTGVLNGTTCNIETNNEKDAEKVYTCTKGTLDGSRCILDNVLIDNYTYTCKYGTLNNSKCEIHTTDQKDVTYVCKTGYTLVGKNCYKTETNSDIYKAEAIYKTVSTKVYKWSTSKTLDGWTKTGETRTAKINVTSK